MDARRVGSPSCYSPSLRGKAAIGTAGALRTLAEKECREPLIRSRVAVAPTAVWLLQVNYTMHMHLQPDLGQVAWGSPKLFTEDSGLRFNHEHDSTPKQPSTTRFKKVICWQLQHTQWAYNILIMRMRIKMQDIYQEHGVGQPV